MILQDTAFARDTTKCPDIRYFSFLQLLQRARNRIFASVFYKHGGERQKINKTTTVCTCSASFFVPVFTAKFIPHTQRLAMLIRQMFWCHKLPPPFRKSSLRLDHLFGSFSSVYSIIPPPFSQHPFLMQKYIDKSRLLQPTTIMYLKRRRRKKKNIFRLFGRPPPKNTATLKTAERRVSLFLVKGIRAILRFVVRILQN